MILLTIPSGKYNEFATVAINHCKDVCGKHMKFPLSLFESSTFLSASSNLSFYCYYFAIRLFSSVYYAEFNMFHMIAVGLSSSILGCLLTLLIYTYCQRYQQQSHDATVIHPVSPAPLNTSITNHINKLDKYDSVEAIKVRSGPGALYCTSYNPIQPLFCYSVSEEF